MRNRILQYLEYKRISKYKFYRDTGLSNGFLDKEGGISVSSYEKICSAYPDLSEEWLRTGKGEMLTMEPLFNPASVADTGATIKSRLCKFIEYKGLNNKQFEEAAGLSSGTVARFRDSSRFSTYLRIASTFPELSMDWLKSGEGEMLKSETDKSSLVTMSTREIALRRAEEQSNSEAAVNVQAKERLRYFIEQTGETVSSFARKCGISIGLLSDKHAELSEDTADSIIAQHPHLSRVWLLTGKGEMLLSDAEVQTPNGRVPILPLTTQGGTLVDYSDSAMLKDCEFRVSPFPQADFGIYVRGDSMAPLYPSGALVFVKRVDSVAFIEWGRVFVVDTLNGSVLKRVLPGSTPDKIKCVSLNSDYAPFEVELSDVRGLFISLGRLIAD